MKILVTGGAGFIGSTVVDEYIKRGHRVWVIDNEASGIRKQVNLKAHYQKMDIRNSGALKRYFSNHKFDLLNHHAAQMDVRRSVADPFYDADVNIIGILNLLEGCRKNKIKKVEKKITTHLSMEKTDEQDEKDTPDTTRECTLTDPWIRPRAPLLFHACHGIGSPGATFG